MAQSPGQLNASSPEQIPSPQYPVPQSLGHDERVSPAEHVPSPHVGLPQSKMQLLEVSPGSHLPLPQRLLFRQSPGHVACDSPPEQTPSPQMQSSPQFVAVSPGSQTRLPQLAGRPPSSGSIVS